MWRGRRAPTIAAVTPGWASVQATARAGSVVPSRSASGREALHEREIAAEQRLGEERGVTAPVVRIEVGDAFGVEGSRQQPRALDFGEYTSTPAPCAAAHGMTVVRAPRARRDNGGWTEST